MGELIKREAAANPLSFSGERLTSATTGQVEIEHYHRYLLAREFCRGRDVLDVAAGEGYGTALLSQVAATTVGVELDQASVDAAQREFGRPNLRYLQGDARALPLDDASIDVVVSFETLEHLAEQDHFLTEIRRVLRPDGLLMISTPDRDVYSPIGQPPNPYHVLELTRPEFQRLLERHFPHVAMAAQRPLIGSVILGAGDAPLRSYERRSETVFEGSEGLARAPYLVALASAASLPPLPGSVFVHRNDLDTDMQARLAAAHAQNAAEQATREALEAKAAALGHMETARAGEAAMAARVLETQARADAADAAARQVVADNEVVRQRLADEMQATNHRHEQERQAVRQELAHITALAMTRQERAEHRATAASERAALAEARGEALEAALHEARQGVASLQGVHARAAELEQRLEAEMTAHFHAVQRERHVMDRLRAIESSNAWKLTHPARQLGERFPGVARRLRQGAKLAWWTSSMQLPRRYRLWREHRQTLALGAPDHHVALPSPTPAAALSAPMEAPQQAPLALDAPPPIRDDTPIRLALSRRPLVSVIVPTYGQVAATLACLRSFAANPPACAYEMIVIDDAYPGPEPLGPLHAVDGIVLLRNGTNQGYLRSCNLAVASARGEFVHLLNNDTEIRPGAVDALVALLQERPDAGLVGSKLLYPNGTLQEAGGILWDDASGWNYGRNEDPNKPEYTYVRETDYCSAASVMLRRSLWDTLGGFDEAFLPAYYEDTDLAFRVRAQGLKVLYEPRSEVVHHEGASHGTDLGAGVKAAQVANQAKMLERWGPVLRREHFPNGRHTLRAAARARGRKTILVIDHYVPEPDRDAGSRSTMGILTSLLDAGWLVKLWPHNRAYSAVYTPPVEAMGIEVLDYRWPGDLSAWLRQYGNDLDHLMAIRPDIAANVMPLVLHSTDAVLSFYGVDLHFARMRRQADLDGNEQLHRDSEMVEQLERRVWRNFDVVIYPSDEEAAAVREMAPNIRAQGIVPFWFETWPARTTPPKDRSILFVAGFAHPPNVDAALFLMEEVIPRLEAQIGHVTVTLAGSKPSPAVQALAGRDVVVTGYVTDDELEALYRRHRVSVVPLRYGAGVKGKVVEALSRGLPLVTTSIGSQGIEGLEAVVPVRDEATALASALAALLTDDAAWVAQSAAQVAFAERMFSRAAMGRSVLAALATGEAARFMPTAEAKARTMSAEAE